MRYEELKQALGILGLGERATLKEIKARHRLLVKRHHPDAGADGDPEAIRKVNAAYAVVAEYLAAYRFCFNEEEFYEQMPDERLLRQFADDPLWGGNER